MPNPKYSNSLISYSRFKTREVMVGAIGIGGENPIRVQSMTTTDTMDTEATVAQSIRMIDAGCELVRITAPSKKEAENLANIKAGLVAKGYNTPICADIHFTPNAAEIAATVVERYESILATMPIRKSLRPLIIPMNRIRRNLHEFVSVLFR